MSLWSISWCSASPGVRGMVLAGGRSAGRAGVHRSEMLMKAEWRGLADRLHAAPDWSISDPHFPKYPLPLQTSS